jgi:hypothetical protein
VGAAQLVGGVDPGGLGGGQSDHGAVRLAARHLAVERAEGRLRPGQRAPPVAQLRIGRLSDQCPAQPCVVDRPETARPAQVGLELVAQGAPLAVGAVGEINDADALAEVRRGRGGRLSVSATTELQKKKTGNRQQAAGNRQQAMG